MGQPPFRMVCGDCRDVMAGMAEASVDAIVTDPPAGISFMGKEWDHDKGGRDQWIAWMQLAAAEALRVAKPGAHALVWALPRTSHWTATAWENAGWQVRDRVSHLFGSGFPKNRNALKPACEDWWLLRKPLAASTVAANVLEHGTGALNIDGCRVPACDKAKFPEGIVSDTGVIFGNGEGISATRPRTSDTSPTARWPANVIHDGSDEVEAAFAAFGEKRGFAGQRDLKETPSAYFGAHKKPGVREGFDDTGTASRFFYVAKSSRADRNDGLDNPGSQFKHGTTLRKVEQSVLKGNNHPTVKPTELMRYLCRLITPPGGTVLDPFAGTGSTGRGAMLEGFNFIGIEMDPHWVDVAQRRIQAVVERARDDTGQRQACFEGI